MGVVGAGTKGLTLARAFEGLPHAELRWLCDESAEQRAFIQSKYPQTLVAADADQVFMDESLDSVVIAAPPETHYSLARRALEADKHVFVDAPLALTGEKADDLVNRAMTRDRRLMVGHLVLFDPAVTKLKELMSAGNLGDLYYLASKRLGCRSSGRNGDALRAVLVEEVAVLLFLLSDQPIEVATRAESYLGTDATDVIFCFLKFATGITAHIHASTLEPREARLLMVVGSNGTAVFDDTRTDYKLTIYENRDRVAPNRGERGVPALGDAVSPPLPCDEPVRLACESFLACVRSPRLVPDNARQAAAIVHILGAANRSIEGGGNSEELAGPPGEAKVIELPV